MVCFLKVYILREHHINACVLDMKAEEEDDTVLDYQPSDFTLPHKPTAFTSHNTLSKADSFISIPVSPTDIHDYDYAVFSVDPSQYSSDDLLRPPSPDRQLEITMGNMEGWDLSPAKQAPRTKRVIAGADLIRGMMGVGPEEDVPQCPMETQRTPSPREKQKPHLTISVPAPYHAHRRAQSNGVRGSGSYAPYPHYQPRRMDESKLSVHTDAGDDILDWGEEDDLECDGTADGATVEWSGKKACGEDIRRARSTPPTPRSGQSFLDVPVSRRSNLFWLV